MSLSPKASEEESTAVGHRPEEIREGSLVEVTFVEEGFKGSWYEAKILTLPENKEKGVALIQYKALVRDEKSTEPLTESAFLSFIRPLPPQPEPNQDFEVGDVVDAFFQDGWWVGIVTEVLDGHKRVLVFFEDPPHELEFSRSDLRAHLDWVDGKWVKPQKKEVPRHIIDGLPGNNSSLGKKRKLKEIGNSVSPVAGTGEEDDTLQYVTTPQTPLEIEVSADVKGSKRNIDNFPGKKRKLKKSGTPVFAAAGMEENGLQIVTMPQKPEEVSVKATSKVSKHIVDSLPVRKRKLLKGGIPVSPMAGKEDKKLKNDTTPQKSEEVGFSVKATKVSKRNVKSVPAKKWKPQKCAIPLSSMAGEDALQIVAMPYNPEEVGFSVNTTSKETKRVTNSVSMKKRKLKKCDNSAPPVAGKEYNALQLFALPDNTKEDGFSVNAKSKEISRPNSHVKSTRIRKEVYVRRQSRTKKKQPQTVCDSFKPVDLVAPPVLFRDVTARQVELSTVPGLESAGFPRSQEMQKQPQIVFENGIPSEIGVPQRILFQELAAKQVGIFTVMELEPPGFEKDCTRSLAKGKQPPVVREISEPSPIGVPERDLFEGRGGKQIEFSTVSRLEPAASNATEIEIVPATPCKTQESEVVLAGKHCVMKEVQIILEEVNASLMNEEDSHCKTRVDDTGLNGKDSNMGHADQSLSECMKEAQSALPVLPAPGDMVDQDVIFVKESPLWKEVECMEVLRAIPQKPHFRPLLNEKEAIREGVALGRMITFGTLVQKASKLEIEDPINSFTYILDSLPELETHGFDVASVKLRVQKLKSLKESQQQLLEKSKASASESEEHSQGLTEIRINIEEIDKKMKILQEEKALLVSNEGKKKSQFRKAQEIAESANAGVEHTREEFARLAASPW